MLIHIFSITSRYDNCGVRLNNIRDKTRRKRVEAISSKLPHIVDCAGLGDVDDPKLREILELLVGGINIHTNLKLVYFVCAIFYTC